MKNGEFSTAGRLLIADIWLDKMWPWREIEGAIDAALRFSRMNTVKKIVHHFKPQGETGLWLLAESHLAVHTYPESKYLSIDLYTCGTEGDPMAVASHLESIMEPQQIKISTTTRGVLSIEPLKR